VFFVALTAIELGAARLALLAATGEYGWSPSFARFLFPLAFVPIAAALLVDPLFAILAGTWAGLSASLLADVPMDVVWISLLSSTVAVTATRKVRTRARLLRAGFWSGTAGIVYVIASGILHAQNPSIVLAQAVGAGASGMLSALGVLLLLPALEWMFGFSSDIRLLEFTDPAHPLLQRLALEAPGTYHHSLMVAHLSQAAAHAIGANELLVRVGAMFHDIGKIAKPGYFIENQPGGLNPHDELSPSMSRMILSSHIREGQALARQHRIPRSIVEAIEQHHGTSRMDFFYNRFVQKSPEKTETEPRDGDFRYDGPRPRSREMSILALADTVEAAVRTQDKPSPARLQALVKDLTLRKLQDGQFGESSLTFRELERVTDAFVFTLVNMAHGRIAYPEHEHRSDTTTGRPAPEDAGHDSVGPVADGAGPAPKSAP
jgi:putative nucleotidyltransferase with HDIG domain